MAADLEADCVLRDVAARIIQYHYRAQRLAPQHTQRATDSGSGSGRRPHTPLVAGPSTGSVLDFMPGPTETRASPSGRPASRPPRPRAPTARVVATLSVGRPRNTCDAGGSASLQGARSQASPPEVKPLPLEDSAERVNRKAAAKTAAATTKPGSPAVATQCTSPAPSSSPPGLRAAPSRAPAARQLQMDVRASASTEKMGSIMRLIEHLERQAVEEARHVAPAPTCAPSPAPAHPLARVLAAQPLSISSRQTLAAATTDATAAAAVQASAACSMVRKSAQILRTPASTEVVAVAAGPAHTPAATKPAAPNCGAHSVPAGQVNAAAVASSVRTKIQQLQQQVAEKDGQLEALRQRVVAVQREQDAALQAAEDSHKAQLAAHKADAEANSTRSLHFIDRVMADKEALSAKCAKLSADVSGMQTEATKQIEALKEGLGRELRRQKEVWVATERAKREAWMAEQTRSIKESTIKGLEPEIQRLVEVHKAEMKRAEQRHEVEAARRLQAAAVQQEEAMAGMRAQWVAERATVLEAEKAAAREQVKDAQNRFEVELQSLRMRLAAEHQMQLDRGDSARREDQSRMQQQAQEYEQRVATLRAEWGAEKQQLARQQQLEVDSVKQQYEVNQEAWRAAASERARREMEAREVVLRRQLAAERDDELAAVVARLEDDALAKEAQLQKQLQAGEAAAEAKWRHEMSRLRAAETSLADKCASAESRAVAAETKIGRLEELVHTLQKEVSSNGSSLAWLEDQLAATKKDTALREQQAAKAVQDMRQQHDKERALLQGQVVEAEEAAGAARQEAAAMRQHRVQEMEEIESRFRGLLHSKDSTIATLTEQLQELHAAVS